jgi:RNA polymerase sigma factor (sigma-70 family)
VQDFHEQCRDRDVPGSSIGAGPAGIEELVVHLDAAYNLAMWLTRNPHDAEDMVQEAYLKAYKHCSALRAGQVMRPWLLAIVRNCCYDFLRKRQIQKKNTTFEEDLHGFPQETLTPETSLLQQARSELVRSAVAELPAEFREVLVLRDLEDLSYREIASIIGIPIGTVMSRLNRGRKRIQRSMLFQREVAPRADGGAGSLSEVPFRINSTA